MESGLLERFQSGLQEKRRNLTLWLTRTPPQKKQVQLGPLHERAAQQHLRLLDAAIERTKDKTFGRCEVCQDDVQTELVEMDYECCVCLEHFSEKEREELEFELELAGKIQQALLPQGAPDIPGVDVAAYSRPAAVVGGDYFDFFQFNSGAHALAVGDAVGHGVSASLFMSNMQASLRILAPESDSPAEMLSRLNRLFHHSIRMTTFVTLFLARYDPADRTLTYANAGHNPPMLYRPRTGQLERLNPTGAAIGLVEDATFSERKLQVEAGDILLMYTDGVTEAIDGRHEEFGESRLEAAIRDTAAHSAQGIVKDVRERLAEHAAGVAPADDTTLVAAKFGEGSAV